MEDLWAKIDDHPCQSASQLISELRLFRDNLVTVCLKDSSELIRWLYENQGVRRFDASNRLFLILIKKGDYFSSWKLKRAKNLLVSSINSGLDQLDTSQLNPTKFDWGGTVYDALASAIYIVKE